MLQTAKATVKAIGDRFPSLNEPLYRAAYGALDLWEWRRRGAFVPPMPRAWLRAKIGGRRLEEFLEAGRRYAQGIEAMVAGSGRDFVDLEAVLDFGCGCGRTLRWLAGHAPTVRLHGTDVDAQAIRWCQRHLTFATFAINEPLPPLRYEDATFDLVYALSVFTHLDEPAQHHWLAELRRVTKPGGLVIATVLSENAIMHLPEAGRRALDANGFAGRGFAFVAGDFPRGVMPEWYQVAYHSESYVREIFGRYFTLRDFRPEGIDRKQSVVVLERPA
ncbi:MAG: class I SAM-dependent methyltransferase [Anaerolineae bacterium]|nr:class I SAM-dependent methyltransferase [Anaerolineae bacterium]